MANYQIPMTGAQITDALTQLVNRVSEGWAVGSRDGNPVTSGSPYYHNNAKYYAENAQDAAARAEAAVPASTAGAVFFDRSQSLTDAQKAQAQANIGASNTNPNLLDNWWFGKGVINQRGVTNGTISSSTYLIDRWQCSRGAYSFTDNGMSFALSTGTNAVIHQFTGRADLTNKTVTISVMVNGNIYSKTGVVNQTTDLWQTDYVESSVQFRLRYVNATSGYQFLLYNYSTTPVIFQAAKLEMGTVSTLYMDAAPNLAEELAKCQRYFQRITFPPTYSVMGVGYALTATSFRCFVSLPVTMRTTPTPSINGIGALKIIGQGTNITPTGLSTSGIGLMPTGVSLAFTASGLTTNQIYVLEKNTSDDGYIDLSADL